MVMAIPAPYWTVVYSVYETFSTLTPSFGGPSSFDELSHLNIKTNKVEMQKRKRKEIDPQPCYRFFVSLFFLIFLLINFYLLVIFSFSIII